MQMPRSNAGLDAFDHLIPELRMPIFSTRVRYAITGGASRFELPEFARNQLVFNRFVPAEMLIKQAPDNSIRASDARGCTNFCVTG